MAEQVPAVPPAEPVPQPHAWSWACAVHGYDCGLIEKCGYPREPWPDGGPETAEFDKHAPDLGDTEHESPESREEYGWRECWPVLATEGVE